MYFLCITLSFVLICFFVGSFRKEYHSLKAEVMTLFKALTATSPELKSLFGRKRYPVRGFALKQFSLGWRMKMRER